MRKQLKQLFYQLPLVRSIVKTYVTAYPPGHYYSPIVSEDDILLQHKNLFDRSYKSIDGIELNEDKQLNLLSEFGTILDNFPFRKLNISVEGWSFKRKNGYFEQADAAILYAFIHKFKPKKIIEVGSGHSSALMLDINEKQFNKEIRLTFIEPFPDRLNALIEKGKMAAKTILKPVQQVDYSVFSTLQSGDFLFIDSSHVSKTGSDLNYLLFNIIPQLTSGVIIHFHDIFYPFEYPEYWVRNWFKGFGWNEIYLLRAFLMNNPKYEIMYFNSFMGTFHSKKIEHIIPEYPVNSGGSIWLKKL